MACAALPSTRTDCSDPAISARPPAALRLTCRSCALTWLAVSPCACSVSGSRMTRISRLTPPLRLTVAMPGIDSSSLATVLSMYQLSCSTVMSLAIAAIAGEIVAVVSARIDLRFQDAFGQVAADLRDRSRDVVDRAVDRRADRELDDGGRLPSVTVEVISSMPCSDRTAASTRCVTCVSSSVGAAPGWLMTTMRPGIRCRDRGSRPSA